MNSSESQINFAQELRDIPARFVSIETVFNVIPLVIITVIFVVLQRLIAPDLALPLVVALGIFLSSLFIARYAIGALSGKPHADLYERFPVAQLPFFAVLQGLITILWIIPLAVLILYLIPIDEIMKIGFLEWFVHNMYLSGAQPYNPSLLLVVVLFGVSGFFVAPLYTAIVTAYTTIYGLSNIINSFLFPLKYHRNFISTLAAHLGATGITFFYSLPFVSIFAILGYSASPTLSKLIVLLGLSFPFLAWPVIIGRLAGTFVRRNPLDIYMHNNLENPGREADYLESAAERPTIGMPVIKPEVAQTPNLTPQIKDALKTSKSNPKAALEVVLRLKSEHPNDASVLVAEIKILLLLNQMHKAKDLAPAAFEALKEISADNYATQLFFLFDKERHSINLSPSILDFLGRAFIKQNEYREAGWCLHTSLVLNGKIAEAGKKLIEVADAANQAKDQESAMGLFKYYIKSHPGGPLADYASDSLQYIIRQVKKAIED